MLGDLVRALTQRVFLRFASLRLQTYSARTLGFASNHRVSTTKKAAYATFFIAVNHHWAGSNFFSDVFQALEDFQAFMLSLGEAYSTAPALAY